MIVLVARKLILSGDMKTARERVTLVLETLTATVHTVKRGLPINSAGTYTDKV